jgi:predicted nucleotidyltransferase
MRKRFFLLWKHEMIDLEPRHRAMIAEILARRVPSYEVRVFGSRVTGTAKPYSDLDLTIQGPGKLPRSILYGLRDDFEDSDLPFRVDVLDWNRLSAEFQRAIQSQNFPF